MPGLTKEQEAKLNEIDAGEGKKLSSAQKALLVTFGKSSIKVKPGPGFKETGPKVEPEEDELKVQE